MSKNDNNKLLEPVAAVESYLDNLLSEAPPAENAPRPVALQEKVVRLRPLEALLSELPPPQPEAEPEPTAEAERIETAAEPVPVEPLARDDEGETPEQAEESPHSDAQAMEEHPRLRYRFPVQCLMFEVADHELCIPLVDMGSVAPLDPDALTRLPGSPDWLLGVLPHRERKLRIVDSALLLGIRHEPTLTQGLHFLVFADEDFAITCERLGEVLYLEDADVRWLEGSGGGLSMGTVRDRLATLLSPLKIRRHMQAISAPAA